jgi:hypothetical protein
MLIRRKGKAWLGFLLGLTFFAVLAIFCAPVFSGSNGLEQSDRLFNRLAKGSSYFIPDLTSQVRSLPEQPVALSIQMENPKQASQAMAILSNAAPNTTAQGATLNIRGTLGQILEAALKDCDAMYSNRADQLQARYGMEGKEALFVWFSTLNEMARKLQQGTTADIANSKVILTIVTKGVEPSYNFYGIKPETVRDRAGVTTALLAFYLVYTVWWGFAIFYMCEGFGLAMTKARVKREV